MEPIFLLLAFLAIVGVVVYQSHKSSKTRFKMPVVDFTPPGEPPAVVKPEPEAPEATETVQTPAKTRRRRNTETKEP